jgi:hypothetical protein
MDGRVEYSGAKEVEDPEIPPPPDEPLHEAGTETKMRDIFSEPAADDDATQVLGSASPPAGQDMGFLDTMEPTVIATLAPTAADSPDLSDIARFGNSDVSSARDGSLRYNLWVTGIDTSDVREAFREAITDRRLVWDIDQILRSVKNGEVRIANVSPAKAFIVVTRLRQLPVHVRWEQYAISQS